jgi:molecular chaperone DnaK (HSP70)
LTCNTRSGTKERTFDLEVTRDELDDLVSEHLLKISTEIKKLLKHAKVEANALDYVVLAGQSSKMPIVARVLGQEFGEERIKPLENLKTCVAKGAYWYGKAKTSVVKKVSVSMEEESSNRTGSSFGVEAMDDLGRSFFQPIIEFGSEIPARGKINHDHINFEEDMSEVRISLYENLSLEDNRISENDDCEKIEPAFLFKLKDDAGSSTTESDSEGEKAKPDAGTTEGDDDYYISLDLDDNKELSVMLHLNGKDYKGKTYASEQYY